MILTSWLGAEYWTTGIERLHLVNNHGCETKCLLSLFLREMVEEDKTIGVGCCLMIFINFSMKEIWPVYQQRWKVIELCQEGSACSACGLKPTFTEGLIIRDFSELKWPIASIPQKAGRRCSSSIFSEPPISFIAPGEGLCGTGQIYRCWGLENCNHSY